MNADALWTVAKFGHILNRSLSICPMLPEGVKSLAEIAEYPDPVDRVPHLARLLEHILRQLTPNSRFEKLDFLLRTHRSKFSRFDLVDDARLTRNEIMHGEKHVTRTQILHAEVNLEKGIRDILVGCPEDLRRDAMGKAPEPTVVSSLPAQTPKPKTPQPQPEVPESSAKQTPPPQPPPIPTPLPVSPPNDAPARPEAFWFILAGVFAAIALLAYTLRPLPSYPRVVHTNDQQPPAKMPLVQVVPDDSSPRVQSEATSVPSALTIDPLAKREKQFRQLINTSLSLSTSQRNVAVVIESTGADINGSVSEILLGFLTETNVRLIGNLADARTLRNTGFFDDLYSGNGHFLTQAAKLSRVDYILLGKAIISFRRQSALDAELLTCDLTLTSRLADHSGTVVHSARLTAAGPGFTKEQAVERAAEITARQMQEKILNAIP